MFDSREKLVDARSPTLYFGRAVVVEDGMNYAQCDIDRVRIMYATLEILGALDIRDSSEFPLFLSESYFC